MKRKRSVRKVLCVMFFTSLACSTVLPQAPKGAKSAVSKTSAAPAKCSGGWSGSVKYTRNQFMQDEKTTDRVSGRGKDTRNWEMKYEYKAVVAVTEDPARNGTSLGRAVINHRFSSTEKIDAVEKNSCDRGKTWRDMRGKTTSKSVTKATAEGEPANVNVGISADGTYSVSVALPQIKGVTAGEQTSSYSGQCSPKKGETQPFAETATTVDGNSLTSDRADRVDPANPNKLAGSFTRRWENVVETITWDLERCGAPLKIIDLAFDDMKFPNWNDWQEISDQVGTIDGNLVRIRARVLNASGETKYADLKFKETYKGDKWDGARPDEPLKDDVVSVRLGPNEDKEIELIWDSSGYAWFDDGRPRLLQRIKAELEENGKKIDEEIKNLKVGPKPVILVHGLFGNAAQFQAWQNILTTSHSYDWKSFAVGENPSQGVLRTGGSVSSPEAGATMPENAEQLKSYVDYAQRDRNAWHVDMVAHSTGGLIARKYINDHMPAFVQDGRPAVAHLLTLGTPHAGSKCADIAFLGSSNEAIKHATTEYAEGFNKQNISRKGVKFSALAGDSLPTICKGVSWGDGFVTVESALWKIADTGKTKSIHTDMLGTTDFSNFVKPRLAIGPKGNHNPDLPAIPVNPGN